MKPLQIHPYSALAGATALGLILLTSSAFQVAQPADLRLRIVGSVQIDGIPTPRQMVRVETGSVLTVPPGKIFVATGIGFLDVNTTGGQLRVMIDGVIALQVSDTSLHASAAVASIPAGLTAQANQQLTVDSSFANREAVLLGYLADA